MKRRLMLVLFGILVVFVVWRTIFVSKVDESTEFTSPLVKNAKWRDIVNGDLSKLQVHRVREGAMFTSTGKWSDLFQDDPAVDVVLLFHEKDSMEVVRGTDLVEIPSQVVFRRKRKVGETEIEYAYGIQGSVYRDTRESRLQATVEFVNSSPLSTTSATKPGDAIELHLYEHLSYLSDKQALRLQVAERVGDEVRHLIVYLPIKALETGTLPSCSEREPEPESDPIFD